MATFRHGKGIRPLIDEKDMSEFLNDMTITASMDGGETTTFSQNWRTFIPGLRQATVSFDGLFAAATASTNDVVNYLDDAFGGSTRVVVTVDMEGSTSPGGRAFLMTGDIVGYDIDAPADGMVGLSLDIQGSFQGTGGVMLRPLSASTSTGSQTGVAAPGTTSAGGTTGGGVGHLHVTQVASTFASATFKIQHSTSGTTWADLITFTAATGVRFQRSTVSGTVKERLRSTISSYTATAGADTITASIAFSRHGKRT